MSKAKYTIENSHGCSRYGRGRPVFNVISWQGYVIAKCDTRYLARKVLTALNKLEQKEIKE